MKNGFQKVWEDLRKNGKHITKYPYDVVVSFVFRYYPKNKHKHEVNILDIGCGVGNHLWFLAREGFNAYGIEGSETAVQLARELLKKFGVKASINVGDFTKKLPYDDEFFDLIIDRSSLSCVSYENIKNVINEIHRVLKSGGYFLFTPYSKSHTSFVESKKEILNNFIEVTTGSLKETGFVCFYDEEDIKKLFEVDKWELVVLVESISRDKLTNNVDASWKVIVRKKG